MPAASVIYWDASAALALLFRNERRSEEARRILNEPAAHLISSLALAEIYAAIARAQREAFYSHTESDEARRRVAEVWQPLYASPAHDAIEALSRRWSLRGADLWHLATARSLSTTLPELRMLTFDERLAAAAAGEKLLL